MEAPAVSEESAETKPADQELKGVDDGILVSNVDELLAAIDSDTVIILGEGDYNLSLASDYGEAKVEGPYTWEDCYDGYQLVLNQIRNLETRGVNRESVTISAVPRYANVLNFRDCENIILSGFTGGHTVEPGFCSGGVFSFERSEQIAIDDCKMFGCGTLGVDAARSREIWIENSEIYECSYGAVNAAGCYDLRLVNCRIHDCGKQDSSYNCFDLFEVYGTTGFAVVNCDVFDNDTQILLKSSWSEQVSVLGCGFSGNRITEHVFEIEGKSPVVSGCVFEKNDSAGYYAPNFKSYAVNEKGEDLITFDFDRMQRAEAQYDGPKPTTQVEPDNVDRTDGTEEYHVSTVDEFLAAIGPDRTVYLEAELFDLSTASNYGGYGGEWYEWVAEYDGPMLQINYVSNFHLIGMGKENTTILSIPRYSDVLRFIGGNNISIANLTVGHTQAGECTGDALCFNTVTGVEVDGCGIYGCGVWGVRIANCTDVCIENCEIYSCSYGAVTVTFSSSVSLNRLDVHDMPDEYNCEIYDSDGILWDGQLLENGVHDIRTA